MFTANQLQNLALLFSGGVPNTNVGDVLSPSQINYLFDLFQGSLRPETEAEEMLQLVMIHLGGVLDTTYSEGFDNGYEAGYDDHGNGFDARA